MSEKERISVQEAARILGVDSQRLRVQLQRKQGLFKDIGFCEKNESGKRFNYFVYKDRVMNYVKW